jgi:hypothetical protein
LIDDVTLQPDRGAHREDESEWGDHEKQSEHHCSILTFMPPSYLGLLKPTLESRSPNGERYA